ncbi:MAG TPA: molybdopterin-guanine dinucleotide biosynthesis protein B [Xanthobacteraceae bacterium]|nr:molybdopterin-guanine dinucleotide biosynthesis protein B [Xanthobacteraceae bacterium]
MKVIGLAGWSGSGKTTLLAKLIPALLKRGVRVSTVKHAHHHFDLDKPGKDSYVHREAGASEVFISSANRWAQMHELRGAPELHLRDILKRMSPVDLVIVEGFKREQHPKIEIHRAEVGKSLLQPEDNWIVAIASDIEIPRASVPVISLDDIEKIADVVLAEAMPIDHLGKAAAEV